MAKIIIDIADIKKYIGQEIGASRWVEIPQSRVNKFAEATGAFQWIHMDEERAKEELPAGKTIIQNYLLVSLIPQLFDEIAEFSGLKYGLNRGANNIQFLEPLPTGSKIRIRLKLSKLQYVDQRGLTATFPIIMERDGGDKPILAMELQLLLVAA